MSDKRRYVKCECHGEVHSGLQLPREIVVEKSGEFREAYPSPNAEHGNPEPSPEILLSREGAETRASARTPGNPGGSARHPQPKYLGRVMR